LAILILAEILDFAGKWEPLKRERKGTKEKERQLAEIQIRKAS